MWLLYIGIWILVILYNMFLNNEKHSSGYSFDVMPIFRGLVSIIVGLILTLVLTFWN